MPGGRTYDRARDLETFHLELEHRPGLTMRVRRPGFAGERAVRRAWPVLTDPHATREAQEPALFDAAGALAGALVSWTLEFDGAPVPCTQRALSDLDTEFLLELVTVWVGRVVLRPAVVEIDPELDDDELDDDGEDQVPDEWDPENPVLDEEWLSQLPAESNPAPVIEPDPEPVSVDA